MDVSRFSSAQIPAKAFAIDGRPRQNHRNSDWPIPSKRNVKVRSNKIEEGKETGTKDIRRKRKKYLLIFEKRIICMKKELGLAPREATIPTELLGKPFSFVQVRGSER